MNSKYVNSNAPPGINANAPPGRSKTVKIKFTYKKGENIMAKRFLSVALALIMCLGIFPAAVSSESSPTYLKDIIGTFSGTYVFSNEIAYEDTYQTGTATLTLNENELSFEMLMFFYHLHGDQKTVDLNIATKFKFDETGYNDWDAMTFVEGKPHYVEGGLNPGYKIGDLLNETEVEFIGKDASPVGKDCYKISVFGMMDFYFYDTQDGKTQKAVYNDTVFERTANDQFHVSTSFVGEATTKIVTSSTTEWSGWMVATDKVEIDGNVNVSGKVYLLLTDDAELTVNGSIDAGRNNHDNMLTVYAQKADTGSLTVKGESTLGMGYLGSITVNGGNVTINGGSGINFGIRYGNTVNVAGGVLTVIGGNGGGNGISGCAVTVSGGELYSIGGDSDNIGGTGLSDSTISVTGGAAVIAGGVGSRGRYYAFGGSDEMIDAEIFYATGDINNLDCYPIVKGANQYHILKLLPKTDSAVQTVSYIDGNGVKQTTEATELIGAMDEWSGWLFVDGRVKHFSGVTLTEDTNIILADGAELIVGGTINCNGYLLSIYVQNTEADAGKVTVQGTTQASEYAPKTYYGIDGNITVNGGIVNITGGGKVNTGYPGIRGKLTVTNGDVTVTGGSGISGLGAGVEGGVTVLGGKTVINGGKSLPLSSQNKKNNAPGIESVRLFDEIRVSGGELYVNGSGNGYGVDGSRITVDGGMVVINGGKDGGKAYNGQWDQGWINADIAVSKDGHIFLHFNNTEDDLTPADAFSIRLTAKTTGGVGDDDNPTSPQTGDNSHLALWAMLMGTAFVGLVSCGILGKKRKTER